METKANVIGPNDFFTPSENLAIDYINKVEAAIKTDDEKSVEASEKFAEVGAHGLMEIRNFVAQNRFGKNFDNLDEAGKAEILSLTQPFPSFNELPRFERSEMINDILKRLRGISYSSLGFMANRLPGKLSVSKPEVISRIKIDAQLEDDEFAKNFTDELFNWIVAQDQPVQTGWGTVTGEGETITLLHFPPKKNIRPIAVRRFYQNPLKRKV